MGNLIYAACQWAMLAVLAKLGTTEMVGQFALALAVATPVLALSNLNLRGVIATDALRIKPFGIYASTRALTAGLSLALIFAIATAGDYTSTVTLTIVIVGFTKAIDSVADVFQGLFQQHERMDRVSKSLILNGLLSILGLSVGLILTGDVVVAMMGSATASFVVLAVYTLPLGLSELGVSVASVHRRIWRRIGDPVALIRDVGELVGQSAPLGVAMLLLSLATSLPRFFLEQYEGATTLGVFAALSYLLVAGTTVITAVGQAATPRLAMQFANKQLDDFSALLFRLLAIALALSIAGLVATYLFGPKIVSFLYTDEYSENNTALLWLVVSAGMGFFSSFFGCALTAARKFGIQAVTNGAMVIVLLLACWMLIPAYDLLGAALASVAGAGTKLILSSIVMIKTIERARGNHD